jgi:hypothetical protein
MEYKKKSEKKYQLRRRIKGNVLIPFLFIVVAFGVLLTSGAMVNISPTNPNEKYIYDGTVGDSRKGNLQLNTLKFKIQQPDTFDCNSGALIGSNEPIILWAIDPPPGTPVGREGSVKAFYQDEFPLTLGSGDITPNTSSQDHVVNPKIGDETARDANGFPFYPALFFSDITNDPTNRSGDAQNGGTPHKPDEVFGAWKPLGTGGYSTTPNNFDLGPDADPYPAEPNVKFKGQPSIVHGSFGAEIVWNVENLGLEEGHTYRAQFILHDGDREGDISEGCTTIQF